MTELERFLAVVRFQKPDYWPLLNVEGHGYIHLGGLAKLHQEGLPAEVNDVDSWCRYWGECTIDTIWNFGADTPGVKSRQWCDEEFEYIEYETGARTRQVRDSSLRYSMPDFQEFHVRDRASWEKYRPLITPRCLATEQLEAAKAKYAHRTRPLRMSAGRTWGGVRMEMGPERALLAIYDDPELVRDIIAHRLWFTEKFVFPGMRALRPEIVSMWEDFAYNHGMMISPAVFREFCAPYYRRVAEVAHDCGAELLIVDCDGKVDEFCLLLEEVGFNGCWPMERVCGNELPAYRRRQPRFIFAGGIEKRIVNAGHGDEIEGELVPKVPTVLASSGYFPMFDHAVQVDVGFTEHCRALTRLHEICGSDLGTFPRVG